LQILGLSDAERLLTLCQQQIDDYAKPETVVQNDTAAYVRFSGSLNGNEVWMYDQTVNHTTVLNPGSPFSLGGGDGKKKIEGKVVTINNSFVIVEIEGEQFRLELGDSLRQIRKI